MKIWRMAMLMTAGCLPAMADLIQNAGFEQAGSGELVAQYWEAGNPDGHGGWWGSAERVWWRAHNGSWEMAIRGTWASAGDNGGLWQERPCTPHITYRASAWFWANNDWSSASQDLRIEFFSSSMALLATVQTAISDVGETWAQKTVQGRAPADAAYARVVIQAGGAGANGSLQVDDVELYPVAGNLLQNPSLETQGTGGGDAQHWEYGNPDTHGGYWNSATRVSWRAHSGTWEAAIRGTWAEAGDLGGLWQERICSPGATYVASAWLWANADWSSSRQVIALDFYDANGTWLSGNSQALGTIGESWERRTCAATAPGTARYARMQVLAEGAGPSGSLQIDDLALTAITGDTTYWKSEAGNGNWNANHWYNSPLALDNHNINDESGLDLLFANDNQTTMNNDLSGLGTDRWRVRFVAGATQSRTIAGTTQNAFYDNAGSAPQIENGIDAAQTLNFPLRVATAVGLELNPVAGDLTLGGTIDNGGYDLHVWGDNGKMLTLAGIVSGGGKLILEQFSKVRVTGASTFTGHVEIDEGEFWLDAGGALGAGTLYVGHGGQPAEVAKLWLTDSDGGLSLENRAIVVNPADANTKFIGGLNTSGVNTFGGSITLNGPVSLEANNAGGTVAFNGAIGGAQNVILNGPGRVSLGAENTFSGVLYLDNGTLELARATGDSLDASELKLGRDAGTDAATVILNAAVGLTLDCPINVRTGSGGQKTLRNAAGHNTCAGSLYLDSDFWVLTDADRITFSGAQVDVKQKVLLVGGEGDAEIASALQNSTGINDQHLVKFGSGTLIGSAGGSFGGGIYVDEGTLRLDHNQGVGTGTVRLGKIDGSALDATLLLQGGRSVANPIAVRQPNSGTITIGSTDAVNDNALTGSITLDKAARFTVPVGRTLTHSTGSISGAGALTKIGAGTLVLAGNNSYSGGTAISDGTLVHNGANTDSDITVASGATLAGNGTVGPATVAGTVAPGNGVGVLHVAALTMDNGAILRCEIGDASDNNACDRVADAASVTLTGSATLALDDGVLSNWSSGQSRRWTVVAGGVSSATGWVLDTSTHWSAPVGGGRFSLAHASGDLLMAFTPVPQNVSASDNTFTTHVAVQWSDGEGETGYRVYRDTDADPAGADQIGGLLAAATTQYDDATAVAGQTYYYWVKAVTTAGDTDFSAPNAGTRATVAPLEPTTVFCFD